MDPSVRKLINQLESVDPETQYRSIRRLAEMGPAASDAVDALVSRLTDTNRQVRELVVRALCQIGDRRATHALADRLGDHDDATRDAAADAVAAINDREVVARLIDKLNHEDPCWRRGVARALGLMKAEEAINPLLEKLNDPIDGVRHEVAAALGRIGDTRVVGILLRQLVDVDPKVREAVAEALAGFNRRDIIPALMSRLSAPHWSERCGCVTVLGAMKAEDALSKLVVRLADDDPEVRRATEKALVQIDPEWASNPRALSAVPKLVKRLTDPSEAIRRMAADALGRIGDLQAIDPLVRMLGEQTDVACAAAEALGALGDLQPMEALASLLGGDVKLATAAMRTIVQLREIHMPTRRAFPHLICEDCGTRAVRRRVTLPGGRMWTLMRAGDLPKGAMLRMMVSGMTWVACRRCKRTSSLVGGAKHIVGVIGGDMEGDVVVHNGTAFVRLWNSETSMVRFADIDELQILNDPDVGYVRAVNVVVASLVRDAADAARLKRMVTVRLVDDPPVESSLMELLTESFRKVING